MPMFLPVLSPRLCLVLVQYDNVKKNILVAILMVCIIYENHVNPIFDLAASHLLISHCFNYTHMWCVYFYSPYNVNIMYVFFHLLLFCLYNYHFILHYHALIMIIIMLYVALYFMSVLLFNVYYYPDIFHCIYVYLTYQTNFYTCNYIYIDYLLCMRTIHIHVDKCYFIGMRFRIVGCIKGSNMVIYIMKRLRKYNGPS